MLRPRKVGGRWVLARAGSMAVVDYSAAQRGAQAGSQQRGEPAASAPTDQASAAEPGDPIEQIKQLSELREHGILTEEEFTAEKAKLLGI
jgi:hypothetical protein